MTMPQTILQMVLPALQMVRLFYCLNQKQLKQTVFLINVARGCQADMNKKEGVKFFALQVSNLRFPLFASSPVPAMMKVNS